MSSSTSSERLTQVLSLLEAVNSEEKGVKMQELSQVAKKAVEEMQEELKRNSTNKQLVELVKSANWAGAAEVLQNNFAATTKSAVVKEVLTLAYSEEWRTLKCVFNWVQNLEAELQSVACEELYKLIKANHHTDKPLVLLLLKNINECLIDVRDNVRADLEADCRRLIDCCVEDIKKKDYILCNQTSILDTMEFFMPVIVSKFDVNNVDSVQHLIRLSQSTIDDNFKASLCIVTTLLKMFEENLLMDSEQALYLLIHVIKVTECYQSVQLASWEEKLKMFQVPLEKLNKRKPRLFLHYQRYLEDYQDKQKFQELLNQHDWFFASCLVLEFVTWYFNGDSKRTQLLIAAAKNRVALEMCNFRGFNM